MHSPVILACPVVQAAPTFRPVRARFRSIVSVLACRLPRFTTTSRSFSPRSRSNACVCVQRPPNFVITFRPLHGRSQSAALAVVCKLPGLMPRRQSVGARLQVRFPSLGGLEMHETAVWEASSSFAQKASWPPRLRFRAFPALEWLLLDTFAALLRARIDALTSTPSTRGSHTHRA